MVRPVSATDGVVSGIDPGSMRAWITQNLVRCSVRPKDFAAWRKTGSSPCANSAPASFTKGGAYANVWGRI